MLCCLGILSLPPRFPAPPCCLDTLLPCAPPIFCARPLLNHLKVIAVDEYDECFDTAPEAMFVLLSMAAQNNATKPQVGFGFREMVSVAGLRGK